jgi:hypothetical protein
MGTGKLLGANQRRAGATSTTTVSGGKTIARPRPLAREPHAFLLAHTLHWR